MQKVYSALLGILSVISLVMAGVYLSKKAGALPHFFPGYSLGSQHMHTKHGIAFLGLAIIFALVAWMVSGPNSNSSTTHDSAN